MDSGNGHQPINDDGDVARCVAHSTRTGNRCKRLAITGGTVCPTHGGRAPQVQAAAQRRRAEAAAREAIATYGLPIDINPDTALLQEVHRTAGHVAWLGDLIGDFTDETHLKQYGASTSSDGTLVTWERPAVWVELYHKERAHLVSVCKAAVAAGIAERQVRLAEQQGELVAELLRVAITAAGLTPEQTQAAYGAIRAELTRVA
jgi:hypothetical protein